MSSLVWVLVVVVASLARVCCHMHVQRLGGGSVVAVVHWACHVAPCSRRGRRVMGRVSTVVCRLPSTDGSCCARAWVAGGVCSSRRAVVRASVGVCRASPTVNEFGFRSRESCVCACGVRARPDARFLQIVPCTPFLWRSMRLLLLPRAKGLFQHQ